MIKVVQRKVWVTVFTCRCGRSKEMWHYGEKKRPDRSSYPSSGKWNGWDLCDERCPSCAKEPT